MTHDDFVMALTVNPCDKALWLVYADWLEERGDVRAEYVRRFPVLMHPWTWVTGDSDALVKQLRKEVGRRHVLYKKRTIALARQLVSKDVLFLLDGSGDSLAVVRLAWKVTRKRPLVLYTGWDHWVAKPEIMDYSRWSGFDEQTQQQLCQSLHQESWLFQRIETEFSRRYGNQPGIESLYCGSVGFGGNSIVVTIRRGHPRVTLPRRFMGFPVERSYARQDGARRGR
jgi:uncharacterized protein (TIGR02996 family)